MTEKRKPRPGPSSYENHFLARHDIEDRAEWRPLCEIDLTTGRVTRHADYKPFNQTPLSEWKPPRR